LASSHKVSFVSNIIEKLVVIQLMHYATFQSGFHTRVTRQKLCLSSYSLTVGHW